jgi:hypothetical protein
MEALSEFRVVGNPSVTRPNDQRRVREGLPVICSQLQAEHHVFHQAGRISTGNFKPRSLQNLRLVAPPCRWKVYIPIGSLV